MRRVVFLHVASLILFSATMPRAKADQPDKEQPAEITLSTKEIGRLDIFEDRALSEADAAFGRDEFEVARTKYGEFLEKHPKSPVAAYALYRKARSAENDGKREDAIVDYTAVAEKFPKQAKYAIPALLRAADCHLAAGSRDKATEVWSRLAENNEYRKSPRVAEAIERLADLISKSGKPEELLKLYDRLDLNWHDSSDDIVKKAIATVIRQHVRTKPDQAKLTAFYKKINKDSAEKPEADLPYWIWVADAVLENGQFSYSEDEARKKYYGHWTGVFQSKFPESDDIQIALIRIQYGADRDRAKLSKRLDEQFAKKEKSEWRRTLKWVRAFKGNWTKTKEYSSKLTYETAGVEGIVALIETLVNNKENYLATSTFKSFLEKVPFDELSNEKILQLLSTATEFLEDRSVASGLVDKLHFSKMTEAEKLTLAREFLKSDGAIARKVYNQLKNKNATKVELFEHFIKTGEKDLAIDVAGELAEVNEYSKKYSLKKAELLMAAGRHSEAATAYQKCGNRPEYLWKVVDCYIAMKDTDSAVEQLRAIAAAHKSQGAKATYRIAILYRDAEAEDKHLDALREVVKKYPGTREAEEAAGELGEKGVAPSLPIPSLDL